MNKKGIHNIFVPVLNLSEIKIVMKQASYFHDKYSASINLMFIMPKISFFDKIFTRNRKTALHEKRKAYSELVSSIWEFYNYNFPDFITIKIEEGNFLSVIKKELRNRKYDLIILKEFSEVKSLLSKLQAISDKIMSRVDCPVMILHEKWTQTGISEILIPIDINRGCKDTVLWAIEHSKKLNAKINFIAVVNTSINVPESLTFQRSKLIKEWIDSLGITCSFEILKASPEKMAASLLEYAEKDSSDLIMILTHEEFILSNNYLGKFAKEVIHHSPKPVISMSIQNRPLFRLMGEFSKYGRKRTESLNLKKYELPQRLKPRFSNNINIQEA